ncbi:hypothetical protein EJB05_28769, partial [Eragrostis curvula]
GQSSTSFWPRAPAPPPPQGLVHAVSLSSGRRTRRRSDELVDGLHLLVEGNDSNLTPVVSIFGLVLDHGWGCFASARWRFLICAGGAAMRGSRRDGDVGGWVGHTILGLRQRCAIARGEPIECAHPRPRLTLAVGCSVLAPSHTSDMGILAHDYLAGLTTKNYIKEMEKENKPKEDVEKEEIRRIKGHLSICLSGMTALYWSSAADMLIKMHSTEATTAFLMTLCFLVGVLFMVTGGITATFPDSAPCKMGISGLGAWFSLVFTLASFHLGTFALHNDAAYSIISMVMCFAIITVFWGAVAQEPVVLHVFAKLAVWCMCRIVDYVVQFVSFLKRCLAEKGHWIYPLALKVVAGYHLARDYLPDSPPFLPDDFLDGVTKKNYEKGYHGKSKEEFEEGRLTEYLASCFSGLMSMYLGGAIATVVELNETHPYEALLFTIYFTVALVVMLTGVVAATFPSTCPCKMGFAGFGALQAVQFIVATFHLATFKLYLKASYLWISLIVSLSSICVFWGAIVQDPLIIVASQIGVMTQVKDPSFLLKLCFLVDLESAYQRSLP